MTNFHSDALVFFGATGDLAYKKIFPSLASDGETRTPQRPRGRGRQSWMESRSTSRSRKGQFGETWRARSRRFRKARRPFAVCGR